jgi:hypothetical protein
MKKNSMVFHIRHSLQSVSPILFMLGIISFPGPSSPAADETVHLRQASANPRYDQQDIRAQVTDAIRESLQEGSGVTADGLRYSTYLPPSTQSLAAVQRLGDKAIPILSEFLWSKDDRESWTAMRFLGSLGGARIVKPFGAIARRHPSAGRRKLALTWLATGPWELASPILQAAATEDLDPAVRKTANDLLQRHAAR